MKKFTESIESNDLFSDEQNMHNLLVEFGDNDFSYIIEKIIQRNVDMDLYPINMDWRDRTDHDSRTYIIRININLNFIATDKQRVGNPFSIPNEKFYTLIEIIKDIQGKIELTGNTLLVSIKEDKVDLMVVEGNTNKNNKRS